MFKLGFQDSGRRIWQIKCIENIVGYIISHKNHLNRQIFCAKTNVLLEFFALAKQKKGIGPTLRQKVWRSLPSPAGWPKIAEKIWKFLLIMNFTWCWRNFEKIPIFNFCQKLVALPRPRRPNIAKNNSENFIDHTSLKTILKILLIIS